MAYNPINWDENEPITAINLDIMDTGIDNNESRISTNETNISSNDSDISNHESRISTNESDISDIEDGTIEVANANIANIANEVPFDDSDFFTTADDTATALNALSSAGVVDEGSTAEGDYIRFENGWQICIEYIVDESWDFSSQGNMHQSGTKSYNYPISFTTCYYNSASPDANRIWAMLDISDTQWNNVRLSAALDRTGNRSIKLFAIGRWE